MNPLVVDYESWGLLLHHFSDGAVVVEMEMPMIVTPLPVDPPVPVVDFAWPRPPDGTFVTILEPDLVGLRERSGRSNLARTSVVGADMFADEPSFSTPGGVSPLACPVCGAAGMQILSAAEAEPVVRAFADVHDLEVGERPSERRGTRWQVGGRDLDAFRCRECLSSAVIIT